MKKLLAFSAMALSVFSLNGSAADELIASITSIERTWDQVSHAGSSRTRKEELEELIAQAETLQQQFNDKAEPHIWLAIVQCSYAKERKGLTSLTLINSAKKHLEKAIALNPAALQGSAYTILGTLYYKVPKWPLSFGNDKMAEKMLKKSLQLDPDGINPNYYYGDFLVQQQKYNDALHHFNKALKAPLRDARIAADSNTKSQIIKSLGIVQAKLEKNS